MHARCRIRLFGGLAVDLIDRTITRFRTQKTGELLAYVAFYRHLSHPREFLLDLLWPEDEPDQAHLKLRLALNSLRRQLEPPGVPAGAVLIANRQTVALNPSAYRTDVADFKAALQRAALAGDRSERLHQLIEAVDLYRGELLPGYYDEWVLRERGQLVESLLEAMHRLVRDLERVGDLPRALAYGRQAVAADPLWEQAQRDLMHLLAASGQPREAVRQYRRLERLLRQELDATPEAATRALLHEIERRVGVSRADARRAKGARPGSTRRATSDPGQALEPSAGSPSPAPPAHRAAASLPPAGTVTFLVADDEENAEAEAEGPLLNAARWERRALLSNVFRQHAGCEVGEESGPLRIAFAQASDAVAAAVAGLQALAEQHGLERVRIPPIRIALDTGEVGFDVGTYHGAVLHHAVQLVGAAHVGQILCAEETAILLRRNLEPGIRLIDLGYYRLHGLETPERLFQVQHASMPQREFPPPRAAGGYIGSLPLPSTRFFDREEEIARLGSMLLAPETRLVTLTGPGGIGKTRLAVEAAQRWVEALHTAVWFAPLADLSDPEQIPELLRNVLRLPRTPGQELLDQVVVALSGHPTLLLLDNFEHLMKGTPLVGTLLQRAPRLKCLVTSRVRLGLAGERELPVLRLATPEGSLDELSGSPDPAWLAPRPPASVSARPAHRSVAGPAAPTPERLLGYDSVQLFVDRAQAVRPDFQVTPANARAVAQLCHRLEGIPLAIELAAARAQVLTPTQMLAQMRRRLDFLVSRRRDVADRHRTLRAAVEWSYRLLSPDLQRAFASLSIFRGGCTLEAVEQVLFEPEETADPARASLALDYLSHLQECSLVQPAESGAEMRFSMLETLREFAAEQLSPNEGVALARRHAAYYRSVAEQAAREWTGPEPGIWLERLEAEHDTQILAEIAHP